MDEKPHIGLSLSARLLLLTAIFILLAEAFIYVPSIARYRKVYLKEHMETAHLAALALEAAPDQMVDEELENRLLKHAEAYGVVLVEGEKRMLVLSKDMPPKTNLTIDLSTEDWMPMVMGAFETLFQQENRVLRVVGPSPRDENVRIEVIIDEAPLRMEMADYSRRILNLSLMISLFTGVLIYVSLHWLLVRPIRRLAKNMAEFRENPEEESSTIVPSGRRDELGQAEGELQSMQGELRKLLRQKDRLASIGTAVAKINHDLRNSLSKAMLMSDQLAGSEDKKVSQLAPQLSQTVDQAIDLCSQTMDYVSNSSPRLEKELFYVGDLIEEVISHIQDLCDEESETINQVDAMAEAEGDLTQLRRVLVNLSRNALQMGASRLEYACSTEEQGGCLIDVSDNGPGLPQKAQDNLFKPFEGSARRGGTGLGLVIARDIMRSHGGDLILLETGVTGTSFRLRLPRVEIA
ncbi:putative sensor histidine kinase [Candidatus Terasakiella magnetica]|uniref:histidine kinase n=1 Tax=Candidatus Terasakiella magnetica TaxID=1867952 RepID=A0A1C3RGR0_9PROT|nr:HAMP domain-containing sensor histidine kinase [Candidatus Terasakiella magnetica]SCA56455.1 putative sensor histidine kinase [Candidatus Terasakiella magnetica]